MRGLRLLEFLTGDFPRPACPPSVPPLVIPDKATETEMKRLTDDYDDVMASYESQLSAYRMWLDEDARAAAILTASMEDCFAAEVVDFETTQQMWAFLRRRYEPSGQ